jgi:hypothetical protein
MGDSLQFIPKIFIAQQSILELSVFNVPMVWALRLLVGFEPLPLQCGASSSIIENQKIQTFALILPILSI